MAYDGYGNLLQITLTPAIRALKNAVTDIGELHDLYCHTLQYYPTAVGVIKGPIVKVALLPEGKYTAKIFSKGSHKDLHGSWTLIN
jgi:hypothetical protein